MLKLQIIKTEQKLFDAAFEIIENENIIGKSNVSYERFGSTISCNIDNRGYSLVYDKKAGNCFNNIINDNGECLGNIQEKFKKVTFFTGIYYHEINILNKKYYVYGIGRGRDGIYFPIYLQDGDNEKQVSLLIKDAIIIDFKNKYNCYIKEENDKLLTVLFGLYIDYWYYRTVGNVTKNSKFTNLVYTKNKFLLEKYDSSFLDDK